MCRLFGQVSSQNQSAHDFLLDGKWSLLKQSFLNKKHLQKDGWGLAHWDRGVWKVAKSPNPVYREKVKFSALARNVRSKMLVAHIRHASNPKKLKQHQLISFSNTQPFTWKNLVFAHNGTLNIPDEVARTLGPYQKLMKGKNDSEALFWLFVKIWRETPSGGNTPSRWRTVFQRMVSEIETVWSAIPRGKRRFKRPFRGLNMLASDGHSLAAHCLYEKKEILSLCGQKRPYFQICYNVSAGRTSVASEPITNSRDWKPLPNRTLLVLQPGRPCRTLRLH